MKKTLIFLFLILLILIGCGHKPNHPTKIDFFSDNLKTEEKPIFFFSTFGGDFLLIFDINLAQDLNEALLLENPDLSLSSLGLGNSFVAKRENSLFLFTAKHCIIGFDSITENIGYDISAIPLSKIKGELTKDFDFQNNYFEISNQINDNDSVFIFGHLCDLSGNLSKIKISGIGQKEYRENYLKDRVSGQKDFVQDKVLVVKLEENLDLSSLSGAPVFNKKGKVIGVYSGRNVVEYEDGSLGYFLRISLF